METRNFKNKLILVIIALAISQVISFLTIQDQRKEIGLHRDTMLHLLEQDKYFSRFIKFQTELNRLNILEAENKLHLDEDEIIYPLKRDVQEEI